jgi:hypothetical protein
MIHYWPRILYVFICGKTPTPQSIYTRDVNKVTCPICLEKIKEKAKDD